MISAYAVDSIIIVKWNGNDEWGEPATATNVPLKGYVEWKTRLVRNILGEEVVSPIRVHLQMTKTDKALGRALRHEDRLTVDGRERAIIAIGEPKSFSCPHYEVDLA